MNTRSSAARHQHFGDDNGDNSGDDNGDDNGDDDGDDDAAAAATRVLQ